MQSSNPRSPDMGDLETMQHHIDKQLESIEKTIRTAYPSRDELLELLDKINGRLTELEISKAKLEGKATQSQVTLVLLISIVGLALTVVHMIVDYGPK